MALEKALLHFRLDTVLRVHYIPRELRPRLPVRPRGFDQRAPTLEEGRHLSLCDGRRRIRGDIVLHARKLLGDSHC